MRPDRERPPPILIVLTACVGALAATAPAGDDPIPSLDELLGLTDPEAARGDEPDTLTEFDPAQAELDRQLESGQIGQAMERAAGLMDQTARRLAEARDPGVVTQRLQEDTLRLLDQVIAAAQQNQDPSGSPSPSSSSPQQDGQQPDQPRQQQGRPGSGEPGDTHMPAEASGVEMRPGEAGAGAAWGALPERLRSALMQGLSDRYSSIYERATESYYRRLAEEESP